MLLSIGLVFLGLILLVLGGEALLRGAVGLATLAKLTPAVIGLTVVAAPSVSALIPNEHLLKFVDVGLDAVP